MLVDVGWRSGGKNLFFFFFSKKKEQWPVGQRHKTIKGIILPAFCLWASVISAPRRYFVDMHHGCTSGRASKSPYTSLSSSICNSLVSFPTGQRDTNSWIFLRPTYTHTRTHTRKTQAEGLFSCSPTASETRLTQSPDMEQIYEMGWSCEDNNLLNHWQKFSPIWGTKFSDWIWSDWRSICRGDWKARLAIDHPGHMWGPGRGCNCCSQARAVLPEHDPLAHTDSSPARDKRIRGLRPGSSWGPRASQIEGVTLMGISQPYGSSTDWPEAWPGKHKLPRNTRFSSTPHNHKMKEDKTSYHSRLVFWRFFGFSFIGRWRKKRRNIGHISLSKQYEEHQLAIHSPIGQSWILFRPSKQEMKFVFVSCASSFWVRDSQSTTGCFRPCSWKRSGLMESFSVSSSLLHRPSAPECGIPHFYFTAYTANGTLTSLTTTLTVLLFPTNWENRSKRRKNEAKVENSSACSVA